MMPCWDLGAVLLAFGAYSPSVHTMNKCKMAQSLQQSPNVQEGSLCPQTIHCFCLGKYENTKYPLRQIVSIPCTTTNFQCPLLNRLSTTLALLQTIETMSHFTAEPEKCSCPVAYNKLVNSAHDPGRNKVVMFLRT